MKKKQREIFLEKEGDAYFSRNKIKLEKRKVGVTDPVINVLENFIGKKNFKKNSKLLEIGCGEGKRLKWISKNLNIKCYGIDPSKKAINIANRNDVKAMQGTADNLKFDNDKFDIVVFGTCLYLCDRSDLFQIAKETDRVLKRSGYVIIRDFFSSSHQSNKYKHNNNIFSYKMDYRKLFDWHPYYNCIFHHVSTLSNTVSNDNKDEWRATSILRKHYINND